MATGTSSVTDTTSHAAAAVEHEGMIDTRKMGVWTFLGSEVIFFGALIVTYLTLHNRPTSGPTAHESLSLLIPTINTMILLISSVAMVMGLAALRDDNVKGMIRWILVTAGLGTLFLILKGVEYYEHSQEGLTPAVNVFGSVYYTLTGFHALHVLIGVLWMLAAVGLASRGRFSARNYIPIEIMGLYWHFVDLVWVAVFMVVYLIR
ncbi:MAG: heme-copper oxidase subunit III [Chloroflexi bacterium]|nr:heme-copper oxidase subunit III [Chloroflexota bacterium]